MNQHRRRSFWGWGWEDKFPSRDQRQAMAGQVESLLGVRDLVAQPQPQLEEIILPPPRRDPPPALLSLVTEDRYERACHTYGRGYRDVVRGFRGDFSPAPDWVALPRTEEDVALILREASTHGLAVVPFGGGTSVVGGVECEARADFGGVISLDLRHLNRVLEVDTLSRTALIEAGATGPQLETQLADYDLTLRHFPQSFEFSTLGGWLATRAGGHFATLYTHIDDLTRTIRMVTPSGIWDNRPGPPSGSGPAPERWILGSEGTLGVITRAWMCVQERPRWRLRASLHFPTFEGGVAASRLIAQAGLYPSNCRLLDAAEANLNGVTEDGSSVLIVGFESADLRRDEGMAHALDLARSCEGTCPAGVIVREQNSPGGKDAGASWKDAFIEAPYLQNILVSLGVVVDTFETSISWTHFYGLHQALMTELPALFQSMGPGGRLTCRFTHVYPDGPAPYYTFLVPGQPGKQLEQWSQIKRLASDILVRHGAAITHHHAVGRTHKPWYDKERSPAFTQVLQATRRALDPAGILNPGVLF